MPADSTLPAARGKGNNSPGRWLLPLFAILFLSILLAGISIYRHYFQQAITGIHNQLETVAQLKAGQIENWLQERRGDAWTLAHDPLLAQAVAEYVRGGSGNDAADLLVHRLEAVRRAYHYLSIQLMDKAANRLLAVGGKKLLTAQELDKAQQALRTGKTVYYNLHRESGRQGRPVEHEIIVPLALEDGSQSSIIGALYIHVDVEDFLFPLIQRWPLPNTSGESLLVRRVGDEVVFMNDLRFRAHTAFNLRQPLTAPALPAAQALRGHAGSLSGRDYRGVAVLASARQIAGTDWILIAKIDQTEIYAPVRTLTYSVIAVTVILLGAITLLFYTWRRSIRAQHQLAMRKAAVRVLEEEHQRIKKILETALDAFISIDTQGLILDWNPAAEKMFGWPATEAIGKRVHEVIIPPESEHPHRQGLARFLGTREDDMLNRTHDLTAMHRSGYRFPISLSLAVNRDVDGVQTVNAFIHDMSESREAEQKLRTSEEKFRTIAEGSPVGIYLDKQDGSGEYVNDRCVELTGVPAENWLAGDWLPSVHTKDREQVVTTWSEFVKQGDVFKLDYRWVHGDGKVVWIRDEAVALRDANGKVRLIIGTLLDITERKQAEKALKQSEERFQLAVEGSNEGIWDWDILTGRVWWSPRLYELLGYREGEIDTSFKQFLQIVHLNDRRKILEVGRLHLEEHSLYDIELRIRTGSGEYRWYRGRGQARWNKRGKAVRMLGSLLDIEENKQIQLEMDRSRERLQSFFDAGLIGMAMSSVEKKWIDVNETFCRMTGYAREELLGMTWSEMTCSDDIEANVRVFDQVMAGEIEHCTLEKHFIRQDGTLLPAIISARAIRQQDGALDYFVVFIMDISERKTTEEKLYRTNRALRTMIRVNECLVHAGDESELLDSICKVIIEQADYKLVWLGYAEHDERKTVQPVVQQGFDEGFLNELFISWAEDVPEGQGCIGQAVRDKAVVVIQDVNTDDRFTLRRDIARRYGFNSAAALPLEIDSQNTAVLAIYAREPNAFDEEEMVLLEEMASDLAYGIRMHRLDSEKVMIEKMLKQAQKLESIGHLSGGLAHDFNNLLGILQGCLEILSHAGIAESERQKWTGKALDAVRRGAALTGKMLNFSQVRAVKAKVHNVNAILVDMRDLLRVTLTPAITFRLTTSANLWPTYINVDEFEDVILNLVVNARDAMAGSGNLLIETSNKVLDADYARLNPGVEPGQYVLVSVSDTGAGMSEAVQAHLFEPFFTTKGPGEGSGLGLSMVYGFMRRSGGHVKVYTDAGHGTTFRLYLPRSQTEKSTVLPAAVAVEALPRGSEIVLVVDDEQELREIARVYLEALGYRVFMAEDAAAALQRLHSRDGAVDLLFSDVVMPGDMDGYALARQVTDQWPSIKLLMTSGFTDRAVRINGMASLPLALVEKPYSRQELALAVRAALDNAGDQA